MKVFKNYKSTFILLAFIIMGGILGLIFGEDIRVLSPFGDLFLNMLLVIVVPLIFLTITTSIWKMDSPKRIGKILTSIILVFVVTSVVALIIGMISGYSFRLIDNSSSSAIIESLDSNSVEATNEDATILDRTVSAISTSDFVNLLSKDNMIALIVISILVGIAMNLCKEKAKPLGNFLQSSLDVLMKFIGLIMYYAPIGLGCYFAVLVGTFGGSMIVGYLKTFIIYLIVSILFFFIVYSIYALIAGGKRGLRRFWRNILPVTITSIATCSSAASMPVNMECTKKMGVSDDVVDATISLGTSFHKDGSIIGSVFKIMFLVYLFNMDFMSIGMTSKIFFVALVATLLVTAVPIGGGTISEMLIISMMGFPVACLPILTIIATIIDAPATLLNVVGDSSSCLLVSKMVDGDKWVERKT